MRKISLLNNQKGLLNFFWITLIVMLTMGIFITVLYDLLNQQIVMTRTQAVHAQAYYYANFGIGRGKFLADQGWEILDNDASLPAFPANKIYFDGGGFPDSLNLDENRNTYLEIDLDNANPPEIAIRINLRYTGTTGLPIDQADAGLEFEITSEVFGTTANLTATNVNINTVSVTWTIAEPALVAEENPIKTLTATYDNGSITVIN